MVAIYGAPNRTKIATPMRRPRVNNIYACSNRVRTYAQLVSRRARASTQNVSVFTNAHVRVILALCYALFVPHYILILLLHCSHKHSHCTDQADVRRRHTRSKFCACGLILYLVIVGERKHIRKREMMLSILASTEILRRVSRGVSH